LLLHAATEAAGVPTSPSEAPIAARVLLTPAVALVIVVNETSKDAGRRVVVDRQLLEVPVEAGRARLLLIERASGKVLAATEGAPIQTVR
jgi:hypothetical protein